MVVSSGGAELVGILLTLLGPLLGAALGAALQGALASAAASLLVLSAVHAVGIALALGSHRLSRTGHWLGRPALWAAGIAVLMVGGLSTYTLMIYSTFVSDSTSGWLVLAPVSSVLAQLGSVGILSVWLVERLVGVLADLLRARGGTELAGSRWESAARVGRRASVAAWGLTGLCLSLGSLVGVLLLPVLLMVAEAEHSRGIWLHGGLMLLGVVAGARLSGGRLRLWRQAAPLRPWVAVARTSPVGGTLGSLLWSLAAWWVGELLVWAGGAASVLGGVLLVAPLIRSTPELVLVGSGAVLAALGMAAIWLGRLGGRLRATVPRTSAEGRS